MNRRRLHRLQAIRERDDFASPARRIDSKSSEPHAGQAPASGPASLPMLMSRADVIASARASIVAVCFTVSAVFLLSRNNSVPC